MAERRCIQVLRELIKLEKYKKVINDDGSVAAPKSQVFLNLSDAIGKSEPLTAKNIYTILKLNRYQLHTFILGFYNISKPLPPMNISLDDSGYENVSFSIDISDIWKEIECEEVNYDFKNRGTRKIGTLKRGAWTNFLFEEIYKCTLLKCPLTFKRSKTTDSGYTVKVDGFCPECNCEFTGFIVNKPSNEKSIMMECCLYNYDSSFNHIKKRQLKGSKRVDVGKELEEGKTLACIWRRKEADKLMDYGDEEPPHLFKSSVLRNVKRERQNTALGVKSTNVFENLQLLKYDAKFEGSIRSIGFDPIFIHYFTNEQIAIFQKHHNTLIIDATGSLMKKIRLPNGELSPHLFLHQCVTKIENSVCVPVCQMVSAVQNTNALSYWLFEFLRIGSEHTRSFPVPKEVITDFNRALLGAVARAFAKKNTLSEYLSHCFRLLLGEDSSIPQCLLRLDVCHFMNMVARWKCWDNGNRRVKEFYMRSIASLRNQNNLEALEKHAKAIFIMCLNSNVVNGNSTEISQKFLKDSITGVNIDDKYLDVEKYDEDDGDDEGFLSHSNNIFLWASNLLESCKAQISNEKATEEINAYYCPAVAKKLKSLLPYFPLFSDVMPPKFGYGSIKPTSAPAESEFNDLKNRFLKNFSLPMRIDKFVIYHLSSFPGKLKIGLATDSQISQSNSESIVNIEKSLKIDNEIGNISVKKEDQSITSSVDDCFDELFELRQEENWRNKNNIKKRTKYIDTMPQFDPALKSTITVPIIVNGIYCKNVSSNGKIFVLSNTCAFDSICQTLAIALTNNLNFKELATNLNVPVIDTALILVEKGLKTEFYNKRAQVMFDLPIYSIEKSRTNIYKINGEINVANLASSLFFKAPSCKVTLTCKLCNDSATRDYTTISANTQILNEGFHKLEEAVQNSFCEFKRCCEGKANVNKSYGSNLLIETDLGKEVLTPLHSIPLELNLCQKYKLAGVISYAGNFKANSIGHYTAYVNMLEFWMEFDDMNKKGCSRSFSSDHTIHAHLCIYVAK